MHLGSVRRVSKRQQMSVSERFIGEWSLQQQVKASNGETPPLGGVVTSYDRCKKTEGEMIESLRRVEVFWKAAAVRVSSR